MMQPKTKLTQTQVDRLYDILNRFHQVCTESSLSYSMCGGTALGAIRHKGLIPWDDDGDLYMFAPQFYNRSMELFTAADAKGLIIRPFLHINGIKSDSWFKIYLGDEDQPNVDIFVLKQIGTRWIHHDPIARKYFPDDYLTNDQLQLYRVPFGPLNLWMFSNHRAYFNRNYGNDWETAAWDGYDHINNISKPARTNVRRISSYSPALPSNNISL